jgi:hypothetical protein
MFGLASDGYFVTGALCTNGVTITILLVAWATQGQTRSCCMQKYPRHQYYLQVPRDSANLTENGLISWVDYMNDSYV